VTINLVTTGIKAEDARAINVVCNKQEFSEIFEVPVDRISSGNGKQTSVAVDIAQPGGQPVIVPGSRIIQSWTVKEAIPWILVTVFEWDI
jgi:hypothetical protein